MTETTKKSQKSQDHMTCFTCNYSTKNKYDWRKHLQTKKHLTKKQKIENENNKNKKKKKKIFFNCENCGNTYKFQSGLYRHMKVCIQSNFQKLLNLEGNNKNIIVNEQSEQIRSLHELLQRTIETQSQTVEKVLGKVGNTTNINNAMTINLYLNEECKDAMNISDFVNKIQLSLDDLQYTKDYGYAKGITKILLKNMEGLNPSDRPIHCYDSQKMEFFVKDEEEWNHDQENKKIDESIESITRKQIQSIKEWESKNPDWNKTDSGTESYMTMVKEVMGGVTDNEKKQNYDDIKKEIVSNVKIEELLDNEVTPEE